MRRLVVFVALLVVVAVVVLWPRPAYQVADSVAVRASAPAAARLASRRPTQSSPPAVTPIGWGSGPDQVGRRHDPESLAEGPMSLVYKDGTLYILDQVNARVLRRRGGVWLQPIALPGITAQDLRVGSDGSLAVLDRLGTKTLQRYDAQGSPLGVVPLAQLGVIDPGGTTGLYDDGHGALYVEESLAGEGRRVLHALDGTTLPGRPSRDGTQLVTAAIVARTEGRLVVRGLDASGAERWTTPLTVDPTLLSIPLCDTDGAGNVYVGVLDARMGTSHDLTDEQLDLWKLTANGSVFEHVRVSHPPSGVDQLHELTVADDGVVWWMHPDTNGSGEVIAAL